MALFGKKPRGGNSPKDLAYAGSGSNNLSLTFQCLGDIQIPTTSQSRQLPNM
jgi:hypothetical protein